MVREVNRCISVAESVSSFEVGHQRVPVHRLLVRRETLQVRVNLIDYVECGPVNQVEGRDGVERGALVGVDERVIRNG